MPFRAKAFSLLFATSLIACAGLDDRPALAQGTDVISATDENDALATGKGETRCNSRVGTIFLSGSIQRNTNAAIIQLVSVLYSEGVEEVWLVINSGGGDVGAAFSFYEFAKTAPVAINTYASAQVHSAAVILFMAGKRRVVDSGASLMIHQNGLNYNNSVRINNSKAKGVLDWNANTDRRVVEILAESTGNPAKAFSDFFNGEDNYITPATATELNIATDSGGYPVEFGGWLMEVDGASGPLASYKTVFNPGRCPSLDSSE